MVMNASSSMFKAAILLFVEHHSTTINSSADALFSHKISVTLGGKRVYIRPADTKEKFSVVSSSWEICCRCVGMPRAHAVVFVKFLIFKKIKKRFLAEILSL